MFKGSIRRPGKLFWLMLVAAEVTSMVWMEAIFGRETWVEDPMIVDFGAILSCAYWLVLSTIYRTIKGILLWLQKREEKKSLKNSCWRGGVGWSPGRGHGYENARKSKPEESLLLTESVPSTRRWSS
jgi:hypothetical protein